MLEFISSTEVDFWMKLSEFCILEILKKDLDS